MPFKPDCGTLPWLAAALTILGTAGRLFLPAQPIWPQYLFFGVVVMLALSIAYFGWRCHVERQTPAPHIAKLIVHLSKKKGFAGTLTEFNKEAQMVLYPQPASGYIRESVDYCSPMIANDFIKIVGTSRIGQPDSGLYIGLTDKANKLIKDFEKNDAK